MQPLIWQIDFIWSDTNELDGQQNAKEWFLPGRTAPTPCGALFHCALLWRWEIVADWAALYPWCFVACDGVALQGQDQTAAAFTYCRTTHTRQQDTARLYLVISRLRLNNAALRGTKRLLMYLSTAWQSAGSRHAAATLRYTPTPPPHTGPGPHWCCIQDHQENLLSTIGQMLH